MRAYQDDTEPARECYLLRDEFLLCFLKPCVSRCRQENDSDGSAIGKVQDNWDIFTRS